jgi:SLT domain-containing protein
MPSLPGVSEDFTADASGYLAAIQAMIDETKDLIGQVNELHAAIDSLPDVKDIEVNITGDAMEAIEAIKTELDELDDRTLVVNVVYRNAGRPDEAGGVVTETIDFTGDGGSAEETIRQMTDALDEMIGTEQAAQQETNLAAAAQRILDNVLRDTSLNAQQQAAALKNVTAAMREARLETVAAAAAEQEMNSAVVPSVNALNTLRNSSGTLANALIALNLPAGSAALNIGAMSAAVASAARSANGTHGALLAMATAASQAGSSSGTAGVNILAMATAAKSMGTNIGGATIPLGMAAFGITGLGTAIHLVIMGIFEFSAVFIPAMIAAGAAASVLNQGFGDVYDGLKGMEIAGEALGPVFGKTQGDMLGLGHSLQIAQNAADPDAYEILGEAIIGVNDATGHLNDQLGNVTHTSGTASGGISSFGQMGIAVGGILEKFAADIDIDLQTGMQQFTGLISSGVADLVEFGQILGNIGHAILNLASKMPGLAEIILKILDGFSDLIKVISELPTPLIAVVMGIEEAYRWSGLLVGVFGLAGRALALMGTLGIPVIAKIGLNMGAMVANVITGVGAMVINFVSMGEKIGVFGADVDKAATSMVGGLGEAASFMAGPWGAAIMLGVGALTVLTLWLLRTKSATQQWIATSQQAVTTATNLTVLNAIGQQMSQTTQKIAQQTQVLNVASKENAAIMQSQAIELHGVGAAANAASGNVNALTSYQHQLFSQSTNVISGAEQISKAYGVSFVAALGLADAANVKLVDGISGNSKAAEEARIQIQGLVQGYTAMNQTGNVLSNSMQAVNVQAQIQGTKVSALNSAWDSFLTMATSLTSSFSQINLDLQQMGNVASTTPSKIRAFAGSTTLSVKQIAESLKSFSGTSAQTWQAYDQSLSAAETFVDNLRTASAAGAVTSTQFTQAISGVVNELLPYAKNSAAARSELSVLVQEAGGPAITSFSGLKNWVDQTGGATVNLGGLVDNLTGKLSNVTQVAKNFAGTLQSDVLSAIANAAVGTGNITGLTQKYTQALEQNGAQAPQTQQAQQALQGAMEKLGFTQTEAQQTTNELSSAYNLNTNEAGTNAQATNVSKTAYYNFGSTLSGPALKAVETIRAHTSDLTQLLNQGLTPAIGSAGGKAGSTANGPMKDLQQMTQSIHGWTQQLEIVMGKWPQSEHTNVNVTGTGGASLKSTIPGVPGGSVSLSNFGLGLAAGGVIPGYAPGRDLIPAMLSPGEGILTPDAVKSIGGAASVYKLNAQHFASGGIALPNVSKTTQDILGLGATGITDAFKQELTVAMGQMQSGYNKYAQTAFSGVSGNVTGWLTAALKADGAPMSWLPALAWLTQQESSGNPAAVDPILVDGEHATGLLQTLPSTFAFYENSNVPGGILNPIANAAAAIRYIEAAYGSPLRIPGMFVHDAGYDSGGWLMPGLTLAHNNTGQPERVVGPGDGDGGVNHVHVYLDGKQIWDNQQRRTLQYDARNNGAGNVAGRWAPNRSGNAGR